MYVVVGNVFVEDDAARGEKMIGCKRSNTISPLARRITHEDAFTGFTSELHLLFLWYEGKATHAPDTKMRDVGLPAIKGLEWSHVVGKCGGDREVV